MKQTATILGYILGMLLALWIILPATIQAQSLGVEVGFATLTAPGDALRGTLSGETYDSRSLTAAHASLPMDAMVRILNIKTGKSVVVRINDRLAPDTDAIVAVTPAAARRIGMKNSGRTSVELEYQNDPIMLAVAEIPDAAGNGAAGGGPAADDAARDDAVGDGAAGKSNSELNDSGVTARSGGTGDNKSNTEGYTLQIGVFSSRESAEMFSSGFRESWIVRIGNNGAPQFRVYYSRFRQEEPARLVQRGLLDMGQESFLRRIVS